MVKAKTGLQTDAQGHVKLIVAGTTSNSLSGAAELAVVRYNPDGTLDTTFDPDGSLDPDQHRPGVVTAPATSLVALAVAADGTILVGGARAAPFVACAARNPGAPAGDTVMS